MLFLGVTFWVFFPGNLCGVQRGKKTVPYTALKWLLGICFLHKCPNLPFLPCDQSLYPEIFSDKCCSISSTPSPGSQGASAVQKNVQLQEDPSVTTWGAEMHPGCSNTPCHSHILSLLSPHWCCTKSQRGWFSAAPGCGGYSTNKASVIISVGLGRAVVCSSSGAGGSQTLQENSSVKPMWWASCTPIPCSQRVFGGCVPQHPADPTAGQGQTGSWLRVSSAAVTPHTHHCLRWLWQRISRNFQWAQHSQPSAVSAVSPPHSRPPVSSLMWFSLLSPGLCSCRI